MKNKPNISEQLKKKYHKTEEVTNFKDMLYRSGDIYRNRIAFKIKDSDGNIKSIELYDYSAKNFLEKPVDFTNEYIITPNTNGLYIFKINAIYDDKDINYYFMCEIKNTVSGQ